ncbi:MAG: DUF5711 family protein [Clostridia bacterium]
MAIINLNDYKKSRGAKLRDIKKVLWIVFFIYVAMYASNHYKDYSVQSLQRTFSYISFVNSEGNINDDIFVDIERTTLYDIFESGVVLLKRDILTYINPASKENAEISYVYQNSDMSVGTNKVVVFDRKGTDYSVSNSYGQVYFGKTSSPIINITMTKDDNYVIITDETSYISAITVYDNNNKEIFKWSTSKYNVVSATLDEKTEKLVALCIYQEDTQIKTAVVSFDIKNGEIDKSIDFVHEIPIQAKYFSNGNIAIICRDLVCVIDENFDIIYKDEANNLSAYNFDSSHNMLYAKDNGASVEINVVDSEGELKSSKNFDFTIKAYSMSNNAVYILTAEKVYKYNLELELEAETLVDASMLKIIYKDALYGVYQDRIVRLF